MSELKIPERWKHWQLIAEKAQERGNDSEVMAVIQEMMVEGSTYENQCEEALARIARVEARCAELEAALERMRAPVSDEERLELCAGTPVKSKIGECFMSRTAIDEFIASRAAAPERSKDGQ